jgi:hypothetical protein
MIPFDDQRPSDEVRARSIPAEVRSARLVGREGDRADTFADGVASRGTLSRYVRRRDDRFDVAAAARRAIALAT